jgi:molybdate transport system ATP-binding protein
MAAAAGETSVSLLRVQLATRLDRFELDVEFEANVRALGLFGASGAGKSTVLEALAGWREVARGRIELDGEIWLDSARGTRLAPELRRVGYVPQDLLLFPHLDVEANVRFGMPSGSEELLARSLEVLEIGAFLRRDVATLSGGERQRVALARAVVSRPRLLLLDEPLGALDRPLRRRILPYLLRLREEFDVPLVLVSHDPTEISALCDHALVLHEGRVVAGGAPSDVLPDASGSARGVEEFENVLRGNVVELRGGLATVELGGARLDVPSAGLVAGSRALVTLRADDVLVATERPRGISARNVLAATVERVERGSASGRGGAARLRAQLGSQALWVELTDSALDELALAPGSEVFLVIKTRACRVVATGS